MPTRLHIKVLHEIHETLARLINSPEEWGPIRGNVASTNADMIRAELFGDCSILFNTVSGMIKDKAGAFAGPNMKLLDSDYERYQQCARFIRLLGPEHSQHRATRPVPDNPQA